MFTLKQNTEFDIIGLGEVMLRLSAPIKKRSRRARPLKKAPQAPN